MASVDPHPARGRRSWRIAVLLALVGIAIALLVAFLLASPVRAAAGALVTPAWPDVEVLDQAGRRHRFASELVQDGVVAINFIFTGCSTVCPPQTALLRDARERLGEAARAVRFISISVDPRSDSPAALAEYAKRYALDDGAEPRWTFVTGKPRDIDRLLAAFDLRVGAPQDHPAVVWIGSAGSGRWTRQSALNAPDLLADGIRAALRDVRSARR